MWNSNQQGFHFFLVYFLTMKQKEVYECTSHVKYLGINFVKTLYAF